MTGPPKKRYPRRPPRLDSFFPGREPFFFITFNTYKRKPLLANHDVHEAFCSFCTRASGHKMTVGRYVIMPDHVHLFVLMPREGISLQQWIQLLRATMGKALKKAGFQPPYWQPGFFDHLLRGSESYAEKWDYVRQNPVRAGLTSDTETWPFQGELNKIGM